MAITTKPQTPAQRDLFTFEYDMLGNPTAQRAHHQGLLTAKNSALRQAQVLSTTGFLLLAFVLLVSFLHIFHTLAGYVPDGITPLKPPAWIWHTSAALLTLSIDAIALYLALIGNVAAFAGHHQSQRLVWFFYVLTGLLNGVFFVTYVPGVPTWITEALDASFATVIVLLMTLLVPLSIVAVKRAMQIAETARLKLTVECATLEGIVTSAPVKTADEGGPGTHQPHKRTPTEERPTPLMTPPEHEPAPVPALPTTPEQPPAAPDLTTLTPQELLAQPGSPEVEREIERRVSKNIDRFGDWLREQLQTGEVSNNIEEITPSDDTGKMPSLIGIPDASPPRDDNGVILDKVCPACFSRLSASEYGAAQRWGHCKHCKV